jgi:hypothetical protein
MVLRSLTGVARLPGRRGSPPHQHCTSNLHRARPTSQYRASTSAESACSPPPPPPRRYAVVGAGFAGVATAWHLLQVRDALGDTQLPLRKPSRVSSTAQTLKLPPRKQTQAARLVLAVL